MVDEAMVALRLYSAAAAWFSAPAQLTSSPERCVCGAEEERAEEEEREARSRPKPSSTARVRSSARFSEGLIATYSALAFASSVESVYLPC